jgi:molecular chaperone DnaJ
MCKGTGQTQRVMNTIMGQIVSASQCRRCRGLGTIIQTACTKCNGTSRVLKKKTIKVDIPKGATQSMSFRMAQKSHSGVFGGANGDLYILIEEIQDKKFLREEKDLHILVNIPMTLAALGTKFHLDTIEGSEEIDVPAELQNGETVTVKNKGIPFMKQDKRGNLIVHFNIITPKKLHKQQRELLVKLAELRNEDESAINTEPVLETGFFNKLKNMFA